MITMLNGTIKFSNTTDMEKAMSDFKGATQAALGTVNTRPGTIGSDHDSDFSFDILTQRNANEARMIVQNAVFSLKYHSVSWGFNDSEGTEE